MATYKLVVRYDGFHYRGWQRLGEGIEKTIQGKLEAVLSRMTGKEVLVTGSGRTDAGVHALAQVAHFRSDFPASPKDIRDYCRRYLPLDIAVVSVEQAPERFHARHWVTDKTYLYKLDVGEVPDPFLKRFAWYVPGPLDLKAMEEAAAFLIGSHDFRSFTTMKSKTKSAVREVLSIDIRRENDLIFLRFTGKGFLHNMVRLMTGAIVEVGTGERSVASIADILEARNRPAAGIKAPPHGLYLESVRYQER